MTSVPTLSTIRSATLSDPAYPAYVLLRAVFSVAFILLGLGKFANVLVAWPGYLAQWIDDLASGAAQQAMYVVGVIEVPAGIVVAVVSRIGGWLVTACLAGVIVSLLTFPGLSDIVLRDGGLLVAAVTLTALLPATRPSCARQEIRCQPLRLA